jgi:hypothetical protein
MQTIPAGGRLSEFIKKYVYVGDVPNTKRALAEALKNESGRKVPFVKTSEEWVAVYISSKFYPELNKSLHPYHGTETLK